MRRTPVMLGLLALAGALVSAAPAAAKEGVRATLTTNVPLDAAAGTKVTIGWTLAYDEDGKRRPFGASGVYVRLSSASGGASETGFASEDRGRYTAAVVVPEGGIGDVVVGLQGWTSGAGGTRRSDLLFPITNDPLPGPPRAAAPERAGSGASVWVIPVVAGALLAIAAAFFVRSSRAEKSGSDPVNKQRRDIHESVTEDA